MPDPEFLLLGDALWLEFVNTARTPPGPRDALADPAAYLRWTKAVRIEPPEVAAAFDEARRLRRQL
ncbi:MAG TPA: ABATE domain-containing protein, partial [Gemmatimonadales bacterium]|nr:ABATE domain-containing protein [Gemmatimonadales bacterium]